MTFITLGKALGISKEHATAMEFSILRLWTKNKNMDKVNHKECTINVIKECSYWQHDVCTICKRM